MVKNITTGQFIEKISDLNSGDFKFKGDKPVIVDFYADWCGPCKMLSPIIDKLSVDYEDKIDFYKIDIDKENDLASSLGIQSIPSLLFVTKDGQPSMTAGAFPESSLKQTIKKLFDL